MERCLRLTADTSQLRRRNLLRSVLGTVFQEFICQCEVTIQAPATPVMNGWPSNRLRSASSTLTPCLRAVET